MTKKLTSRDLDLILAQLCVILFAWIIYPYKWIKKLIFRIKKENAIKEADALSKELNKAVYVVQDHEKFYVGTRTQFREGNKDAKRCLPDWLRYDYRHAVIYKAMPWSK